MRRKIAALSLAAAVVVTSLPVNAQEDKERIRLVEEGQVFRMLITAYHRGTATVTGQRSRQGICAVWEERVGKTALVWECTDDDEMGEFLGIWECSDTGFGADFDGDGIGGIQEGRVIDMYFPTQGEVEERAGFSGDTYIKVYRYYITKRRKSQGKSRLMRCRECPRKYRVRRFFCIHSNRTLLRNICKILKVCIRCA